MSTTTISSTTTTLTSSASSVTDQFQTATAQAAATLMPSSSSTATTTTTKKMSNFFHCNSGNNNMNITTTTTTTGSTTTTTGSITTTTTNIRTNNVKLRLKEKTKKKLEEKSGTSTAAASNGSNASAAAAAAAACLSGIVQETITTTTFSKIHDQMAAMATSDPALTMELLGASLNMNPSVVTDQFHHNHHHHQHHHHFHHQQQQHQHHQSSSTKTGSCGTSPSRNNSSSSTATTNLNKSQQQQRQPLTMKLKKLCNPSATNIITSNHQNRRQEDCCTKKDDCHCQACIQRQKIAEELIAEEESSKKKKQKKKKNKSSKQKKDNDKKDDDNGDGDGDDNGEQEKIASKDDQANKIQIQENLKSDQKPSLTTTNESPMDVKIITEQHSNKQQQQQSAKQTKKNKKNKSNVEKLNVGEAKSSATAKTSTTTTTTTTAAPKEEMKKSTLSNNNSNSSNILNDSNGDPIAVDIQQWIKVKNKSKQQPSSSLNSGIININNNTDWIVDDDITTTTTTTTMSDSIDNNLNNDDIDDSLMDHQQQQNNGFKIIHSDKSRKSYSNDNSDLSLSSTTTTQTLNNINDGGNVSGGLGLGSRTIIGLNSAVAASKAKLLAIEAQIAHSNNELKGAVQYISEALEIDSKNPIYYINRAYYHERLNEFEHALRDTESAIRFDECRDHFDHAICLKARCLIGLEQYEQAEQLLFRLKSLSQKFIPFLHKDLLLLRMKKLISCGYTIPLSRIYATRFNTIADSLAMIEQNCQILLDKKLNESDPKLHLWLINHQQQQQQQQQQQNSSSSTTATDLSSDFLNETKLPKIMQYWSQESQRFYQINHNDYDDDEIYFSDEDEREQWYGHPDQWDRSKDILNKSPVQFEDAKEPPNSKGQKALWIGNVSPSCSLTFVTNLFMKFGNVTFCKIFPNEQRSPDVAYLLLHYDNDISPRLVMSYFKDKIVPGISKDDNCPLLIRFRNKNDKIDDQTSNDLTNLSSLSTTTTGTISSLANGSNIISSSTTSGSNSPSSKTVSECYYFRTTGCDRQHCTFRHVIGNKGIDRQTWMRKKN